MQHKQISYWNRRTLLMRHKISLRLGLAYLFTTIYYFRDLAAIEDNEANPQTRDSVVKLCRSSASISLPD
jgi:hypothetical protein